MSQSSVVYQGVVAPDALSFRVLQGDSGHDLTTVTAVAFKVKLPDGTMATWAASISGTPTTTELLAVHVWQPTDTAQLGTHVMVAELTLPGGTTRTEPFIFRVLDPFSFEA